MKTALIYGVSGQDGAYLSELLLEKGYSVFGTTRKKGVSASERLASLGIEDRVTLEILEPMNYEDVVRMLKRIRPQEVYNLTGQSSVAASFEKPVETIESICIGTVNILEGIRSVDRSIRCFNAGSSECFGNLPDQPADESTPFRPRSPYAIAKSAAYWLVKNYCDAHQLFACTGILFNHESPLRASHFVSQKIVSAACKIATGSHEMLKLGNVEIIRDWGWAAEYVDAMWRSLQQDRPLDLVIASGQSFRLMEFVAAAFAHVGLEWENHVEIDPGLYRPTDIAVSRANPKMAAETTGWRAKHAMPDVVKLMMQAELNTLHYLERK